MAAAPGIKPSGIAPLAFIWGDWHLTKIVSFVVYDDQATRRFTDFISNHIRNLARLGDRILLVLAVEASRVRNPVSIRQFKMIAGHFILKRKSLFVPARWH
jgi:hypothetical protein